jgi:hypothetical protein
MSMAVICFFISLLLAYAMWTLVERTKSNLWAVAAYVVFAIFFLGLYIVRGTETTQVMVANWTVILAASVAKQSYLRMKERSQSGEGLLNNHPRPNDSHRQ